MQIYRAGTRILLGLKSGEIIEGLYAYGDSDYLALHQVVEYPFGEAKNVQYRFYSTEVITIKVIDAIEPVCIRQMVFRDYDKAKDLIKKYTYIAVPDASFYNELELIKMCERISVVGIDPKYGRDSRLSVLAICTKTRVVLFDLQLSAKRMFDLGLRHILESNEFLKIVHNSKLLADCLFHAYKVKLTNVFDIKVADLTLHQCALSDPDRLKSLAGCVALHLNLPPNILSIAERSMKHISKRPLVTAVKELAASQAVYVYFTKPILQKLMLEDYYTTVDRYMAHMRDYNKPTGVLELLEDNGDVFNDLE